MKFYFTDMADINPFRSRIRWIDIPWPEIPQTDEQGAWNSLMCGQIYSYVVESWKTYIIRMQIYRPQKIAG